MVISVPISSSELYLMVNILYEFYVYFIMYEFADYYSIYEGNQKIFLSFQVFPV